jgi:predicted permease
MGGRLREWLRRLMSWSRRSARDGDFDEELQTHVALAASEEMSRGVPADEARRRALARLGGVDAAREQHRDARGLPWLESLGRDLRDAVRLLRRSPGFAFVAIASLALGIGANTAVFSIFNALLLRPLPVREPERLVQVARDPRQTVLSYPLWEQIRAHGEIFDGTAAWSSIGANLIQDGALVPVAVGWTSGDFASVLGLRAQRGRWLTLDDERRAKDGGDKMAVVSDAFWRTRLGGADDVIGRVLTLDQLSVTIVGVATPDFTGMEVGNTFDLIVPITARPRRALNARTDWWVSVYARLKAEQTTAQASAALRAVQPEIREATLPLELRPDLRDGYLRQPMSVASATTGGTSGLRFRYRDPLSLTMAGVGLLLLITCANLTNLLLARADARRHEISLRLVLGASRTRLVRQLLVESLLLSTIGAAAGLLVAAWSSRLLIQQLSTDVTRVSLALPLDGRVLAFATLAAVATTLVVGLVPAFRATRVAPRAALAERGRANAAASGRLGHALVAIQIALSFVLLTGAGLLGRTFLTLGRADLGFDPRPVATVTMTLRPGASWGEDASRTSRLQRLRDVARATPGVASAAFAGGTPMSGNQADWFVENTPGLSLPESQRDIYFQDVGSGWFETLGMRVIAGRDFGDADRVQFDRGAIVNDTLARRFFPGQIAIGRTLREVAFGNDAPHLWTIVGVVNDAVYMNAREGVPPTLYRFVPAHSVLVARAAGGDAATMARNVAAAIARADPDVLVSTRRLADQAAATLVRERLVATLSLLFGILALVLASAGVYGVMAYTVGRRRGEIGIRRALGATTPAIATLVLRQSSMLAAIGLIAGAIASVWAMRFVRPLLYGLEPYDAITLTGTALVLALVTLAASWTPIRRATRVDPAVVLREN